MEIENNIPEDWVESTIGKVTVVESGGTPSTKNSSYWGDEIPWITPRDLSSFKGVFIEKGERSISIQGLENSSAKLLPKNTILFSSRAPIGYVVIAQNEIATNQGFKNLICDEVNSHFKYFYYLMKYKADFIERLSSGSTFSEASGALIKSIELSLPPLPEQKAIAKVLTSFDDKIELLQAQNKTLETMAQTIFKEWFGKYQIGDELPEGWKVGVYGDLVDLSSGKGVKKKEYIENGKYEIIGANGIIGRLNKFLVEERVIVTGRVGTLGTVFILNHPCWISDNVLISKPLMDNSFYFSYFKLKSFNFSSLNTGSTQPLITQGDLKSIEIIIPNKSFLKEFEKVSTSFFEKIKNNNLAIQSLTKTRDTLLPKLMSGQVRVNNLKQTADA